MEKFQQIQNVTVEIKVIVHWMVTARRIEYTKELIYKCIAPTTTNPNKVYLGTAEGYFKIRYNSHKKSFRHRKYGNDTTLSKYVWEMKDKYNEMPSLKWSIVKSIPGYSNI